MASAWGAPRAGSVRPSVRLAARCQLTRGSRGKRRLRAAAAAALDGSAAAQRGAGARGGGGGRRPSRSQAEPLSHPPTHLPGGGGSALRPQLSRPSSAVGEEGAGVRARRAPTGGTCLPALVRAVRPGPGQSRAGTSAFPQATTSLGALDGADERRARGGTESQGQNGFPTHPHPHPRPTPGDWQSKQESCRPVAERTSLPSPSPGRSDKKVHNCHSALQRTPAKDHQADELLRSAQGRPIVDLGLGLGGLLVAPRQKIAAFHGWCRGRSQEARIMAPTCPRR